MLTPLVVLAVLSLVGGWVGWPEALHGSNNFAHFLDPVFSSPHISFEKASAAMNTAPSAVVGTTPMHSEAHGNSQTDLL